MSSVSAPQPLLSQPIAQRLLLLGTLNGETSVELVSMASPEARRFAEVAYLAGVVTDEQLVAAFLSLGARDCTRIMTRDVPPALKALIPTEIAQQYRVVPFQQVGTKLHLAMLDPSDGEAVERAAFASGLYVEPWVARASVLFDVLCSAYGGTPPIPRPPPTPSRPAIPRVTAPSRTPPVVGLPAVGWDPPQATRSLLAGLSREEAASRWARARGSIVTEVLPTLVPPFDRAVLWRQDGHRTVGWTGLGRAVSPTVVEDLEFHAGPPSLFWQAVRDKTPSHSAPSNGQPAPERLLWRSLGDPPGGQDTRIYSVWPVVVNNEVLALMYLEGQDARHNIINGGKATRAVQQVADRLREAFTTLPTR
ncbi:MAG: hypothetical protein AB2A00_10355 [Myxococcota bacterium]